MILVEVRLVSVAREVLRVEVAAGAARRPLRLVQRALAKEAVLVAMMDDEMSGGAAATMLTVHLLRKLRRRQLHASEAPSLVAPGAKWKRESGQSREN